MEGLEMFWKARGLKVNFHKFLLYCSPNISKQGAARLSMALGIPLTKELDKYLGHHLIHRGNNRAPTKILWKGSKID